MLDDTNTSTFTPFRSSTRLQNPSPILRGSPSNLSTPNGSRVDQVIADLKLENQHLRLRLVHQDELIAHRGLDADLVRDVAALNIQVERLTRENNEKRSIIGECQRAISASEDVLTREKAKSLQLETALSNKEDELLQLRSVESDLRSEREMLTMVRDRMERLELERDNALSQVKMLQEETTRLETHFTEIVKTKEIAMLKQESNLEARLVEERASSAERLVQVTQQVEQQQERLKAAEQTIQALTRDLKHQTEDCHRLQDEFSHARSEFEQNRIDFERRLSKERDLCESHQGRAEQLESFKALFKMVQEDLGLSSAEPQDFCVEVRHYIRRCQERDCQSLSTNWQRMIANSAVSLEQSFSTVTEKTCRMGSRIAELGQKLRSLRRVVVHRNEAHRNESNSMKEQFRAQEALNVELTDRLQQAARSHNLAETMSKMARSICISAENSASECSEEVRKTILSTALVTPDFAEKVKESVRQTHALLTRIHDDIQAASLTPGSVPLVHTAVEEDQYTLKKLLTQCSNIAVLLDTNLRAFQENRNRVMVALDTFLRSLTDELSAFERRITSTNSPEPRDPVVGILHRDRSFLKMLSTPGTDSLAAGHEEGARMSRGGFQ